MREKKTERGAKRRRRLLREPLPSRKWQKHVKRKKLDQLTFFTEGKSTKDPIIQECINWCNSIQPSTACNDELFQIKKYAVKDPLKDRGQQSESGNARRAVRIDSNLDKMELLTQYNIRRRLAVLRSFSARCSSTRLARKVINFHVGHSDLQFTLQERQTPQDSC